MSLVLLFLCTAEPVVQQGLHIERDYFFVIKSSYKTLMLITCFGETLNCFFCKIIHIVLCFVQQAYVALLIIFCKVCAKDDLFVTEVNFKMLLLKLCLSYDTHTHTHTSKMSNSEIINW